MLAYQDGHCAICPLVPTTVRLHVDHDHKTGRIRGLLCWWCNKKVLPMARDSADLMLAAAKYLRYPPASYVIGDVVVPAQPKRKRKRRTKVGIR